MTLREFRRKYEGHSITNYRSINEMYYDVIRNIAFYKYYGYEDTMQSYEGILKDLNRVKIKKLNIN